jgi:adenylyl cyclase-associated protein
MFLMKFVAKIELVGNVWYVENQKGNSEIEIATTEMQQRVVIINCSDSIIQIKGKCTAISVEQANKLGVVVHDVIVSTVELLNSTKTQVQLNATCPTMTVDNSEGIQIFLGVGVSDKFELLTCKSNEINLYRQSAADKDYSNEIPVPEQFKSYFDESGDLKTVAVRHSGA